MMPTSSEVSGLKIAPRPKPSCWSATCPANSMPIKGRLAPKPNARPMSSSIPTATTMVGSDMPLANTRPIIACVEPPWLSSIG